MFDRKNHTFAGRSASRRVRYGIPLRAVRDVDADRVPLPRKASLQVPAHTVQHLELDPRPPALRPRRRAFAPPRSASGRASRRRSGVPARAAWRTAARSSRPPHACPRTRPRAARGRRPSPAGSATPGARSNTSRSVRRRYDWRATPMRGKRSWRAVDHLEGRVDVPVALHVDHHERAVPLGRLEDGHEVGAARLDRLVEPELRELHRDRAVEGRLGATPRPAALR